MSEQAGEKTEKPTAKRLEEAIKQGQIPRSPEVQTVFVLTAGLAALKFAGPDIWRNLIGVLTSVLGHLHDIPLSVESLPGHFVQYSLVLGACAGPVVLATSVSGLLAGAIQNRFQTASDVVDFKWERLNPVAGFQRIFSFRSVVPTAISFVKLFVIIALSYSQMKKVLNDPIFYTSVDVARIAAFLADASMRITTSVTFVLIFLAVCDYGFQVWRNAKDMMMTKEEVKEDSKSAESNPQVKAKLRQRRKAKTMRKMLQEVPTADVVVANPTHIAVALRYDKKTMKAPQIVAKGTRMNALRIREIAGQHQVPIIENKPLARMMFRYGKVGGEIPAQLFAAVAEILAYVYRTNRYRYYTAANRN